MKKKFYFSFCLFLLSGMSLYGQTKKNTEYNETFSEPKPSGAKADFIKQGAYLSKNSLKEYNENYGDSLSGFNEAGIQAKLLNLQLEREEYLGYIKHLKREFIIHKYDLNSVQPVLATSPASGKYGGNNTINVFPCINEGFEQTSPGAYTTANAVSGWTISSRNADSQCNPTNWNAGSPEFSVIATPVLNVTGIGILPNSPFGGTNVVQLNNSTANFLTTKISQTFPVTSANSLFQFAFAGYWQDGGNGHLCCDQPYFKVLVKDCFGNLASCLSLSLNATPNCGNSATNYTLVSNVAAWSNWQLKSIDLTPFIGTCVTIEAISTDCAFGGHYGTAYFDSQCSSQLAPPWNTGTGVVPGGPVSFCAGSSQAILQAPTGYATYSWVPPVSHPTLSATQATQAILTTSNAIPGMTFTVYLSTFSGCVFVSTLNLVYTTVDIAGIGSAASCTMGANGSATVMGTGSGTGYNYSWLSSTNSVVGTSSVAVNLAPGVYSVMITALGSVGCGSAMATTTVSAAPPFVKQIPQPFCGTEAYLSASATGTNYQWYNGFTPITSGLGGTAPAYTVTTPFTNAVYWLSYVTSQGCKDSTKYTLFATNPGNISILNNQLTCSGASNGVATVSLNPAPNSGSVTNSFYVTSMGTLVPAYSASIGAGTSTTFTATNLSASGIYSVHVFDGLCKYSTTFMVNTLPPFYFTLNPSSTATLCQGSYLIGSVNFPNPTSSLAYTYSWSPSTFLFASNQQQTLITPTTSPGTINTIIYTVAVTPTVANCPQAQTLAITVANLTTPTIGTIPPICTNSLPFMLSANPVGGIYINNSALTPGGLLSPVSASVGLNTFTYAVSIGSCTSQSSGSFYVNVPPIVTVSGNPSICEGQSSTLLASGASTYSWDDNSAGPLRTVSPVTSTSYTVVGSNAATTCTNLATITVTVLPLPDIIISGDSVICLGESTTLTAAGADIYSWSNGSSNPSIVISPSGSNSYTVLGTNTLGSCSDSKVVSVNVSACTGIDEWNADGKGLRIYPNPTSGKLFIGTENEISILLYDELGRIVKEGDLLQGEHNIDLAGLSDGIYLLRITDRDEKQFIRVIKIQ